MKHEALRGTSTFLCDGCGKRFPAEQAYFRQPASEHALAAGAYDEVRYIPKQPAGTRGGGVRRARVCIRQVCSAECDKLAPLRTVEMLEYMMVANSMPVPTNLTAVMEQLIAAKRQATQQRLAKYRHVA